MKFIFKTLFLIFISSFFSLFPDTIYLKNGKKIEGKIINQLRTKIQIEVNGKLELIDKENISKIEFENIEERKKQEELKRQQDEERKKQEELKRQQEEERKKQEELKRQQDEERKKQEELKRQQEELKRQQEEERNKQEIKTPNTEFVYLKTAIFPGWGEYSINRPYKAMIFGGLFWISLAATISEVNKIKSIQKEYDNLSNIYFINNNIIEIFPEEFDFYFINQISNKKSLIKSSINNANNLLILTVFVYFFQFPYLYYDLRTISFKNQKFHESQQAIYDQNLFNLNKKISFNSNHFYNTPIIFIYQDKL